jgi:hypothetical protein
MMISACGVICSDCPAYQGKTKGTAHQEQTSQAWRKIYGLNETPDHITCGGCLGTDEELFYTSLNCSARRCCLAKGLLSCAECSLEKCPDLEKAQAVWDDVPLLVNAISAVEFEIYAKPYCDHRNRLSQERNRSNIIDTDKR